MPRLVRSDIKKSNIRLYAVFSKDFQEKNFINSRVNKTGFKYYYSAEGNHQHAANGAMFSVWKIPADRPLLDILFRNAYNKVNHRQVFKEFLAAKESSSNLAPKKKHWPANTLLK